MLFSFLYKTQKAFDMALYWLPPKLTKEKDSGGWKVPIFTSVATSCSKEQQGLFPSAALVRMLMTTPPRPQEHLHTSVLKARSPETSVEGNYNECKSLPNTQLWPWSASGNKSEGDWVEHHWFILLKPKQ